MPPPGIEPALAVWDAGCRLAVECVRVRRDEDGLNRLSWPWRTPGALADLATAAHCG